jgi:hypothetical protein
MPLKRLFQNYAQQRQEARVAMRRDADLVFASTWMNG